MHHAKDNKRNLLGCHRQQRGDPKGGQQAKPAWFYHEQRGVPGITINKNRVLGFTNTENQTTVLRIHVPQLLQATPA